MSVKQDITTEMIVTNIVRDMGKRKLELCADYKRPAYQYTSLEVGGIEEHDTCEEW
jgi:hypothetical protein